MKYKVGDKVRVRKDLEVGKFYRGIYFSEKMATTMGKLVTIKKIDDGWYYLEEIIYGYNDEMLEPVEDIIEYKGKKYDVVYANVETFDLALHLKEHKEEILDEEEKEYLRAVIKPFRDTVISISKKGYKGYYHLEFLTYRDYYVNNELSLFPSFTDKRMYKGMELDKEYTLEQLGLDK